NSEKQPETECPLHLANMATSVMPVRQDDLYSEITPDIILDLKCKHKQAEDSQSSPLESECDLIHDEPDQDERRIDLGSEAEILKEVPREEIEQPSNDDKLNLGIETNQSRSKTNTETRQSGSEKKEIPPTPLSSRPAPEKPIDPEYSSAQRYENSIRNLALKEIPLWRTAKGKSAIGLNKEVMAALNLNLKKSFSRPWDAADTLGWVLAREKEDHPQHCVLIAKIEIIVQEMDERRNHDRLIQENGIVVQQPNDPTASQGIKPQPGRWAEILNLSIAASAAQKEKERQAKLFKDSESTSA
ncbi:MAG: hypothetical protein LH660_03290, partial [Phormidesmis sp. CAN_BIN36]|nr:hypothetical protein [Phormidesmis sp. CAN_BIN36]